MLEGELVLAEAARWTAHFDALAATRADVLLDLSRVGRIDSAGAALLLHLERELARHGAKLDVENISPALAHTLEVLPHQPRVVPTTAPVPGLLETWGARAELARVIAVEYLVLVADVAWFATAGLFKRRGLRWDEVAYQMAAMGSRALGVVGLIAFLVGGTMALQAAYQLRQFGANIFVADLVGVSITRELGPLLTAIVVAGRSGSAVAAELGTMVITEEIDALRTMGIHPTRYLIVPKVLAITLTQPLLTMLGNALAIGGGFLVAITYLEIGPATFVGRLQEALFLKDLLTGLVKSVFFANIIVTIGALCGLRTSGGADAVGRSATTSVVASIFAVIVADAAFSLLFYFGD